MENPEYKMSKRELIKYRDPNGLRRKFVSGPMHILNPIPMNEEESIAHGNALAKSGNWVIISK